VHLKEKHGVMVLPFPRPEKLTRLQTRNDNVAGHFVDLSDCPKLFEDLKAITFGKHIPLFAKPKSRGGASIPVVDVGSYKASIVPGVDDFDALDRDEFPLKKEVQRFLQTTYPSGMSFVVCRLQESKTYHPFGYVHVLPRTGMFIPTMHYHDHSNDPEWDGSASDMKSTNDPEDWDHFIYCYNGGNLNLFNPSRPDHQQQFHLYGDEKCINATALDVHALKSHLTPAFGPFKGMPALAPFKALLAFRLTGGHSNTDLSSVLVK
jgi:hypothetical protein